MHTQKKKGRKGLMIWLTEQEHAHIKRCAESEALAMSSYARRRLLLSNGRKSKRKDDR